VAPNEAVKRFGAIVETLMISKRVSRTEAMSLARIEAPEVFAEFQNADADD
jgi:hypothetical protein